MLFLFVLWVFASEMRRGDKLSLDEKHVDVEDVRLSSIGVTPDV